MNNENDVLVEYPQDDIDPREKGESWILKSAKYRWHHSLKYCGSVLYHGRDNLAELRTFMHGWQEVENSKRIVLAEAQEEKSWMNLDWSERPLMTTYMEKAYAKVLKRDFNIVCTAINERAQTEQDEYYNKMRIKLTMREVAKQTNPDLLKNHALQLGAGDPRSLKELDMYMQYGYKHTFSMYGEMSIELAHKANDIHSHRKETVKNLVGLGWGGYKDWIDHNGKARFESVRPEDMVISFCEKADFSDLVHAGRVVAKTFGEIARYFDKPTMELIKKQVAKNGQCGNPHMDDARWRTNEYLKFKVLVWDLEFFSYNDSQYEMSVDGRGNLKTSKISYNADPEVRRQNSLKKGERVAEYERDTEEVVYKTCWIVDTDFQYNFGLATNQKRSLGDPRRTKLSYHLEAWNFDNMRFAGLAKRLRPLQEEYQTLYFKLQNFRNKWIPYIIKIDLAALEKTAMKGRTGKIMTPLELLDFMFQQHILMIRQDAQGEGANPNYKPIDIFKTDMASEFEVIFRDMERINMAMQQISGFNPVSSGSAMDPRMLADGYAASMQGTDDSLFLIMETDKKLLQRLSMGILQRQQIAVQLDKVEGYVNVIGPAGVKFMKIDPKISLYDYGISAEDKPDAAARQAFLVSLDQYAKAGLIEPQDRIMIENCTNLKQAEIQLAFRIDDRKKEMQQNDLATQQMQQQGTITNQQLAAQAKTQELQLASQLRIQEITVEQQWQYMIKNTQVQAGLTEAQIHAQAKIMAQQIIEDSKHLLASKTSK